MKFVAIIAILAVGFIGLVMASPKHSANHVSSQTFAQVQTDLAAGGQLLDVRTAPEYASGHIDGATNLSLQDLQAGVLPAVAKTKPVYVYCHSGSRSSQAAAILKAAGYSHITDLGAMTHVQALGGVIKH